MTALSEIQTWIWRQKAQPVFLVGSGISVPSGLPSGWDFNKSLAQYLGASIGEKRRIRSWLVTGPSQSGIRFEQIMQVLKETVDPRLRILEFCECSQKPTFLHRFLTRALERGPVLTTNFDSLLELAWQEVNGPSLTVPYIEASAPDRSPKYPQSFEKLRPSHLRKKILLKLHGSLRDPKCVLKFGFVTRAQRTETSVAATLDRIGTSQRLWGLEPHKERAVAAAIHGKLLVVIGYSGTDDFDVLPTLASVGRRVSGILWVVHASGHLRCRRLGTKNLSAAFPESLRALVTRVPAWLATGQTDAILAALFPTLAPDFVPEREPTEDWLGIDSLPFYQGLSRGQRAMIWGRLAELAGKTIDAERRYRYAIEHSRGSQRRHLLARAYAYVRLGWVSYITGRPTPAIRCSKIAAHLYRRAKDWEGASRAIGNIGNGYLLEGRLGNAINWYDSARRLHRRLRLPSREAVVVGNIGVALRKQGKYEEALQRFRSALRINKAIHNFEGVARDQGNIGNIYLARRRYAEAIRCYERVIKICEKLRNPTCLAIQYGNIGIAKRHQRKLRDAQVALRTALKVNRRLRRWEGVADNLSDLGRVLVDRGQCTGAIRLFRAALKIELRIRDLEGRARVLEDIGRAWMKLGRVRQARMALRHSARLCRQLNDTAALARVRGLEQRLLP
jgi:tetratricopeptide (TPR) repeat protein